MKKETIVIEGITYTVSATTGQGLKDAIKMLKKSLKPVKPKKSDNDDKSNETEHVI